MNERVRAFVAIELPQHAKEALHGLAGQLGQARIRGIRPVGPDGIHLTLKFLGDVAKDQIEAIVDRVTDLVAVHRPFTVELGGVGGFPASEAPRVFWVGVGGDMRPLLALQREIDESLVELGFERERREFRPHLTVARAREMASSADRRNAAHIPAAGWSSSGLPIPVDAVSLIRSILLPDGARYERLARMTLHGGG